MAVPNTPRQQQYLQAVTAQQHNLSLNLQDTLFTTPPSVPVPDGQRFFDLPVRPIYRQQPFLFPNNIPHLFVPLIPAGAHMLDMPVRPKRRDVVQLQTWPKEMGAWFYEEIDYREKEPGPTVMFVHQPNWTVPSGMAGPLRVFSWKTSRATNRVGTFEVELAVDDQLISGSPLHTQIRRGWHVSLIQENTIPEERSITDANDDDWLLYLGVVQEREYRVDEGAGVIVLRGMFRTAHLVDRNTWGGYAVTTYGGGLDGLVGAEAIIGPNGGAIYPMSYGSLAASVTFHDITRFQAMLKLAGLGRLIMRESWDHDRPEFVRIDNAPYSGCVFTNTEAHDPEQNDQGQNGVGYIAGHPTVRYQGIKVLNRIVPIGVEFDGTDLTLQNASATEPYPVVTGVDSTGATIYYVEDTTSQSTYGLVEAKLFRNDVKNPSDDAGTRTAAANVLHAVACGELLKNKSEVVEVSLIIANGADIWALPGDTVVLQYAGWVTDDEGDRVIWLDENRLFIITGREDRSDVSGVRQVAFTIAAPEIEIPVPDLPAAIPALPGTVIQPSFPTFDLPSMPDFNMPDFQMPDFPGMPDFQMPDFPPPDFPMPPGGADMPWSESCCEDPTTDAGGDAVVPLADPVETTGSATLTIPAWWVSIQRVQAEGVLVSPTFVNQSTSAIDRHYIVLANNMTVDSIAAASVLTLVHSATTTIGGSWPAHDTYWYFVTIPAGNNFNSMNITRFAELPGGFGSSFHLYRLTGEGESPPATFPARFIEVEGVSNYLHVQSEAGYWSPALPEGSYEVDEPFSVTWPFS